MLKCWQLLLVIRFCQPETSSIIGRLMTNSDHPRNQSEPTFGNNSLMVFMNNSRRFMNLEEMTYWLCSCKPGVLKWAIRSTNVILVINRVCGRVKALKAIFTCIRSPFSFLTILCCRGWSFGVVCFAFAVAVVAVVVDPSACSDCGFIWCSFGLKNNIPQQTKIRLESFGWCSQKRQCRKRIADIRHCHLRKQCWNRS